MRDGEWRFTAMASPCLLHLAGRRKVDLPAAAAASIAEVNRIERKFSRYREDSVVGFINRSAGNKEGVEVDAETASLLDYAATGFAQSQGLFDITSGVYRRAWDFSVPGLPDPERLEACRKRVGWDRVRWQRPRLVLPIGGMEIDFGGFGKEYAADRVVAVCKSRGVKRGYVNLGGDVAVIGPGRDGEAWRVGIQHPRRTNAAFAHIDLAGGAIATSGDYERYFELDGKRYCHILNPLTGWPVQSYRSISVVAELCIVAGTLASTAMLRGPTQPDWLESTGAPYLTMDGKGSLGGTLGYV